MEPTSLAAVQEKQLSLFEGQPQTNGVFRDSAFTENRKLPLHRWVPWIAGFSATFVDDVLSRFLNQPRRSSGAVLDPFAGVGTTLLQAYLRGFKVAGFEINKYAALAARLKLSALKTDPRRLASLTDEYLSFYHKATSPRNGSPLSVPPSGFCTRHPFFSERVERKVLITLDYINSIKEKLYQDYFRLAFGSVMVKVSNYSYEPSLGRRASSGKDDVEDAPVDRVLSQKLHEMLGDIVWLQRKMAGLPKPPSFKVYDSSFFDAREVLPAKSVDLVVTSPPYLNNYHYVRNTRPQMFWLDFVSSSMELGSYEERSFGKFWQTVREDDAIPLAFRLKELETVLDTLRATNTHKGVYGGGGWANYAATYFNDCGKFARLLKVLLKPKCHAVVVLGNSILQGVEVKTEYFFGEIAKLHGLKLVGIELLRKKRTGASIVNSSVRANGVKTKATLAEFAVIVER